MRQVLLGLVGMVAAGAARAESYSFVAVIQGAYREQTSIQCDGPKVPGRVPTGCILSERAIAYPNYQMPQRTSLEWLVRLGIRLRFIPTARWPSVCWMLSRRWMLPVLASRYRWATAKNACASTRMVGWNASSCTGKKNRNPGGEPSHWRISHQPTQWSLIAVNSTMLP